MSSSQGSGDEGSAEGGALEHAATEVEQGVAEAERATAELAARSRVIVRRSIGSPRLFAIVYTSLASAIYFSLGAIAGHALGLTPLVFLLAALFFGLTALTYVEGASLHQDRGGATVFARYAFNELVSFIAGWAVLLDYIILIAVTTYSATQYLRVFWSPLGEHDEALLLSLVFIAWVVLANIRGFSGRRARRIGMLVIGDLALQLLIVVLGLVLFFDPHTLLAPIDLGSSPTWSSFVFALTIAAIAFTSLESAAGLAGEVRISRAGLRQMVASGTATVVIGYVGIAVVAVTALPVHDGHTALAGRYLNDPVIGIVTQMHPHWLAQSLRYLVAALATLTLVAAANSAMLGLSRLAYSLSTNRQIPSGLGRLHPQRSTPYVLIVLAGRDRGGAGRLAEPRLSRRAVCVRGDARVHDRAPVDLQAALLRARPRSPLRGAAVDPGQGRGSAAAGGVRRARLRRRVGRGDARARTRSLRRPGLDGDGDRAVRGLPTRGRDLAAATRHGLSGDAALRAARRTRLRLDPRAAARHAPG